MGRSRAWFRVTAWSDCLETKLNHRKVVMLPMFAGTPEVLRPQIRELHKMGVVGVWFWVKAWSDQLETKNKRNAFLPFILKEHGSKSIGTKESGKNSDFKDFPLLRCAKK